MRTCITVILLAVASFAWSQQPAGDTKALDGKWTVVSAELGGSPFPKEITKSMLLTLAGEKYTFDTGKGPDVGTVKSDATKKPKHMDITGTDGPNKGKTYLAIYELDGDKLRVCYDLTGKDRPTEFATKKGSLIYLVTYQRAK